MKSAPTFKEHAARPKVRLTAICIPAYSFFRPCERSNDKLRYRIIECSPINHRLHVFSFGNYSFPFWQRDRFRASNQTQWNSRENVRHASNATITVWKMINILIARTAYFWRSDREVGSLLLIKVQERRLMDVSWYLGFRKMPNFIKL